MVDAEQEAVTGKSILKRRVFRNEKQPSASAAAPRGERDDEDDCGKRYVTFDETISVKNDKDLVVKKPLKLALVIENWKSGNATKTALETNGTDRGIVRRLVNTIEDPIIDRSESDSSWENGGGKKDQRTDDKSLCKAFGGPLSTATTSTRRRSGPPESINSCTIIVTSEKPEYF